MFRIILVALLFTGIWMENIGVNSQHSSPLNIGSRVINGEQAGECDIPYQINIIHKNYSVCGGSLISLYGKHFILTAAQCVSNDLNPRNYEVIAGNIYRTHYKQSEQIREVTRILIHKTYTEATYLNDIALISIKYPFKVNKYVSSIPLQRHGQSLSNVGVVSGWGYKSETIPFPEHLRMKAIWIWDNEVCKRSFPTDFVSRTMICAGNSAAGACGGDIGGPLKDRQSGNLVGIVSFGYNCKENVPWLFTRVSAYINWIQRQARWL